jgi:hypothetical protein
VDNQQRSKLRSVKAKTSRDARGTLLEVVSSMLTSGNRGDRLVAEAAAVRIRNSEKPTVIAASMLAGESPTYGRRVSRGLGDTVARATRATGLDRIAGSGCGCAARQDKLNRLIPYNRRRPTPQSRIAGVRTFSNRRFGLADQAWSKEKARRSAAKFRGVTEINGIAVKTNARVVEHIERRADGTKLPRYDVYIHAREVAHPQVQRTRSVAQVHARRPFWRFSSGLRRRQRRG